MNQAKAKQARERRRVRRVRSKIKGVAERPRFCVKRTLKHLYVQIIDDASGKTLIAVSDDHVKDKGKLKKTEIASIIGKRAAEQALAKNIKRVVFDRRDKVYHGRIQAAADGAREGGLQF